MARVFITGATGNVGAEVIKALQHLDHDLEIYAGVRTTNAIQNKLPYPEINFLHFDFTDIQTHKTALSGCEILFLLRPPQISEVDKYFKLLLNVCVEKGVKHIVFLSVQGVETSKFIPHHKIETLIVESNIPYTFLRPAYFMQNFTTTLKDDLVFKQKIYLPAGNSKFTLIDLRDVGAVVAVIMTNLSKHINTSYELTSHEKLTFQEMTKTLNFNLKSQIRYISPNLLSFFLTKRKENVPIPFIFVLIMLHYFPRFQKEPKLSNSVKTLLNRNPISFEQFVIENKNLLTQ